jgi:hypothetical protein
MVGGMKNAVFAQRVHALGVGLVLATASAQATNYYVSTSGSDSNPGTSAQPFRTITYAYSHAAAGVTIHVAPGVYYDYTSGWGIHLGSSGSASSPIVLISDVPGGAIIDGQNASDRNQGFYIDGNYNVVNGFEIRNCPLGGISIWSSGNQILNNHIHDNGHPASTSTNGRDGVYSDQNTSDNVYARNWIDHNGRSGSNLDHGLYLCGNNEVVINNVLFANAATGLQVAGYTTVNNMKVYNNVMAWNGTSGIILWQALNGVDIKNNILYQNGHYGIGSSAATRGGVVADNKNLTGNGFGDLNFTAGGSTYSYSQSGNIIADPGLVNESSTSFDPHLASGSPAIRAGLNLSSVFTTDKSGVARPASGAWDLGPYVYSSGVDTTPPTVSLTGPANGATVSGSSVTVSANASDNVGVASVQFKLDGASLGSAVTASPYKVTWDTTQTANGSHTLSAVASDAAGNQASTNISVTVNNPTPAPTVALTSPGNGANYPAPSTITLAASVTANGHTVTAVQFYNGSTLLGQSTTAPYSFTWSNVVAGTYTLSSKAVYDAGSIVTSGSAIVTVTVLTGLSFPAYAGVITAPFTTNGGYVSQAVDVSSQGQAGVAAGGQAVYPFTISTAGDYVVSALVNAPSLANNSFWVNIDAQPTDPTMVWDVPVTTGFANQMVSWRGNGVVSSNSLSGFNAQFAPKVFSLSAGAHQLIIVGREANVQLGQITVLPRPRPPLNVHIVAVP